MKIQQFLQTLSEMEFSPQPDHKLSKSELIRQIRLNIAAEHDAAALYTSQAEQINDPQIKRQLLDIADEERVHIGEFQKILDKLTNGKESKLNQQGTKEVK